MGTEPALTLRVSPMKRVALAVFCVVTSVVSVIAITKGAGWFGWVVATLSGLGIVVAVIEAWPGRVYLRLTLDGFEVRTAHRSTFIRWADVSEFRVAKSGVRSFVVFDFVGPVDAKRLRSVARVFLGAEGMLPDTYGCKRPELARILNGWKAGSRAQTLGAAEQRDEADRARRKR